MSWLTTLVRDVIEPSALSILEWAWSFDPASAPPLFTLPFRFYAYSSTSILLWLYELFPHWLILTLVLLGILFVTIIAGSVLTFPLRFSLRIAGYILRSSLLLFRWLLVGTIRLAFRLYWRYCSCSCLCRRRAFRPRFEVHPPPAVAQPALLDRQIANLNAPPPVRALPAVVATPQPPPRQNPTTRSSRRRQTRAVRHS